MTSAICARVRAGGAAVRLAALAGTVLGLASLAVGQQGRAGADRAAGTPDTADMVPLERYTPPRINIAPGRATSIPLSVTNWTALGPAPLLGGQTPGGMAVSGRMTGIAPHPTIANTIYICAAGGGVWKTADGGTSWTPLTDGQPTLAMGAIALAPSNPSVIYAGTGEANFSGDSMYGRGILKSVDAGATWALMGNSVFDRRAISAIAIDPTNANTVYVAVAGATNSLSGNRGIWKTTDGGATWTNMTSAISTSLNYTDVVINPATPSTVYMAVGERTGNLQNGVYKSTNGGASWALAGNFPSADATNGRIRVAIAPSSPQTLYAAITSASSSGLYKMMKTTDGGTTWTQLAAAPNYLGGQGWYDTTLIVDRTNANVVYGGGAAGSNTIVKSSDGGATWSAIGTGADGNGPHVDHHAIAFDALGRLLDGNDGGIWRLDNANVASLQWTDLNGNLSTTQFVGIALDPSTPDVAFGGSQDNGTSRFSNSLAWTLIEGGDGGMVRVDPSAPLTVYHIAPVGSFGTADWFRRSDDSGFNWNSKTTGLTNSGSALFYAPFFLDLVNPSRLLLGTNVANNTTNRGDVWARLAGDSFTFPSGIEHIAVGPSNANLIYACSGGGVYVTLNGGLTWTARTPAGASDHYKRLAVDPTDSNIAYVTRDRFNLSPDFGHIFRTTNAGTTWTDISSNLPDLPAISVALDAGGAGTADDVIYVGTDAQVYKSTNLGASWSIVGSGLPNARVTDLELNKGLRILAAGTYGRGLWELSLPRLEFAAVTFSDAVTGNNDGAPEPGETITLTIPIVNPNSSTVTGVSATVAGAFVSYGDIPANTTVSRTVNFFVPCSAPCGSSLTVPIGVNSSLGAQSTSATLTLGVPGGTFVEGFDSTSPGSLPANWTTSHTGVESNWTVSAGSPFSAPNDVFAPDVGAPGTTELDTPPIFVTSGAMHVSFKLLFNLEDTYDGCVLEISNPAVNSGGWQDILAAGGSFASGGYTRPASGRMAWTGLSAGTTTTPAYITTDAVLPASAAGQSVRLRFVVSCDAAVVAPGAAGVRIDNFPITLFTCGVPISALPATQTVSPGQSATFTVNGTGQTAWQWRKNTTPIIGATGPSFTIPSVSVADAGTYDCRVTTSCGVANSNPATLTVSCYANCDASTTPPILNVNDFSCFLTKYASGDPYANCDGSTQPPVLNVGDFTCFLNQYAAGCQ
jgi:hypothetical protein